MNVDNIKKIADYIRGIAPVYFNMENFTHDCGTPSCIAGYATYIESWEKKENYVEKYKITLLGPYAFHFDEAQKYFGLDDYQAEQLFIPDGDVVIYKKVTPQIAADVLDNLAETGKVEWPLSVCAEPDHYTPEYEHEDKINPDYES